MTAKKPPPNDIVVCRCMEITEQEIREAIHHGAESFDAVKRVTRAGMGLCQGRTCQHLVERLITQETDASTTDLPPLSVRPPLRPTKLGVIAKMKR
jgi:NAD(P)H-nitrite reductase large subunit